MLRQYTPNRNLTIHSDGTYLITGGLGALGLQVARWLTTQGARHIVLLGRSKTLSQAAKDTVQRLVEGGAEISILKGDVGDMADMERVFESLRRSPVLRGVVHAAGVPAAGDFDSLSADNIRASFAAKVTGTWILHQLTQRMPLDFFVLCSSMVGVWGAKGQPDYVAANNFLDAFAHYRGALGLPVLSINWGPLTGGGMLPSNFVADLARMGVTTSPMDRAVRILGELLRCDVIQTAVVNIDWRLFTAVYEARNKRPLFENIQANTTKTPAPARLDLAEQLRRTPAGEKQQTVREHVQRTLAAVLRLSPEPVPDPRMGFFDLGMDSLTAMEFRDRLESSLGISLPVSVALDYSTVETLTRYLLNAISFTSPHSEQPAEEKSTSVGLLQDLSDEDVEHLLLQKLETLQRSILPES
jgi:acyl carrier protein